MIWIYAVTSVLVISLASFVGLLVLPLPVERLKKILRFLISFAAGALLGDAFIHILPELIATSGYTLSISLYLVGSIVVFYILEHFIHWHHYHHVDEADKHSVGYLNLIGDGFHNFIDGMIIGASFLVSIPLGIATSLAVLFHELPQEIGDFAILLHSGFTKNKALLFNFLSATTAIVGVIVVLWLGQRTDTVLPALLSLTAGGFIYIATVDLIPELHKEVEAKKALVQLLSFLVGIALMLLLLYFG